MSTKFGVDSSSCFSFIAWTHTVTDATDDRTDAFVTAGMFNDELQLPWPFSC